MRARKRARKSTHKLSFHAAKGISEWGTYVKTSKYVRISVCVKDTSKTDFAVGAVVVGTNANGRRQGNLGAVAIGRGPDGLPVWAHLLHLSPEDLRVRG